MKYILITLSLFSSYVFAEEGKARPIHYELGGGYSHVFSSDKNTHERFSYGRANLQFLVVQQVAKNWTIGTGLEAIIKEPFNWNNSKNLLVWRVGDIGYHITQNWRFSFYGGIGKYYREYASYGMAFGAGFHYQFEKNWHLSLEVADIETDISTVPTENDSHTKNDFLTTSLVVKYHF